MMMLRDRREQGNRPVRLLRFTDVHDGIEDIVVTNRTVCVVDVFGVRFRSWRIL